MCPRSPAGLLQSARCSRVPRTLSLALSTVAGGSRCRAQNRFRLLLPAGPGSSPRACKAGGAAGQSASEGRRAPTARGAGLLPAPRVTGAAPHGALAPDADSARGGSWAAAPGRSAGAGHPAAGSGDCVAPAATGHEHLCVHLRAPTLTALLGCGKGHPITGLMGCGKGPPRIVPSGKSAFKPTSLWSATAHSQVTRCPMSLDSPHAERPRVTHGPRPASLAGRVVFGGAHGDVPTRLILRIRSSKRSQFSRV